MRQRKRIQLGLKAYGRLGDDLPAAARAQYAALFLRWRSLPEYSWSAICDVVERSMWRYRAS